MIKIANNTLLNPKDLRVFFKRCLKEFNSYYVIRHSQSNELSVKIEYKKVVAGSTWIGGYAYLNTRSMTIKIPKIYRELDGRLCYELAQVFFHELEHCEGKTHKVMRNHYKTPYPTEWAKEYHIHSVEPKSIPVKSKENKVIEKISSLEKRKKKWENRLRRSENAIKKINRQLKYYEKLKAELKIREK